MLTSMSSLLSLGLFLFYFFGLFFNLIVWFTLLPSRTSTVLLVFPHLEYLLVRTFNSSSHHNVHPFPYFYSPCDGHHHRLRFSIRSSFQRGQPWCSCSSTLRSAPRRILRSPPSLSRPKQHLHAEPHHPAPSPGRRQRHDAHARLSSRARGAGQRTSRGDVIRAVEQRREVLFQGT